MSRSPHRALLEASDATLADRAAHGDEAAFEVLVRRHAPLMRAYAARMLGSTYESDDVVQETFVTAWQRLGELGDGGAVKAWLMRILSRRCIDRIRARHEYDDVTELDTPTPPSEGPEHVAEVRTAREALTRALDELPALQRRCWVLREVGQYSYEEIAAELGIPASTVRGQLARGRRRLLDAMEDWR
ncbi:RNA polymerase sigma factor [Leifsonia sp. TF02-11]|uniref:RNA polymerase sigma factor n=1 Tax=Leifsonia sp. TF02-11 TaxID=2815212 RepID=UPI001AA1CE31|nr:RNA polymerase sigma factor [Leifsonia sp. TF02-11]MBO1740626.1 RNA polymerase sigma factor [Leifsonia sp. TF02-11]